MEQILTDTQALLKKYVRRFNEQDDECAVQAIPNAQAEEWLLAHVPRIALPDEDIERTYYFRWWTYRKHIKSTPEGYVVSEFLPEVGWAGPYNTISCAVAHHLREGRWLRENAFLDDTIRFWYGGNGKHLHDYSNALEAAIGYLADVRGDDTGLSVLDGMEKSYALWKSEQMTKSGLYWSQDGKDGSEFSVSGSGLRTTLNSYQYAGALTIARLLRRKGDIAGAERYEKEAEELRKRINELLWDEELRFYRTLPQDSPEAGPCMREDRRVRELAGYLPWMFGAAAPGRTDAFRQLLDERGFLGKYDATTAERRHPGYGIFYTGRELNDWLRDRGEQPVGPNGHECLWNGPAWPLHTCMMLTALANVLTGEEKTDAIRREDYLFLLHRYAAGQVRALEDGRVIPWIDEDMDPDTGEWIARTRLMNWGGEKFPKEKGGYERGKDYNHSTFCDLVLEGLFGFRPDDKGIRIAPLFPAEWDYAQADGLRIHGHDIAVSYRKNEGYRVMEDGRVVFESAVPAECCLP